MLETLELHNFKSHRSTNVVFDKSRLHALVGANSSGKTSVLQALYSLSQNRIHLNKIFFNDKKAPDFIAADPQRDIRVKGTGIENSQQWRKSYILKKDKYSRWQDSIEIAPESTSANFAFFNFFNSNSTIYLKLVGHNLAQASYSNQESPSLGFSGFGLAPTLDYIRNEAPNKFERVQEMLKQIVPGVKQLRIKRAKVLVNRQRLIEVDGKSTSYDDDQEVMGQEVVLDMDTGDRIPAHAISEGTMLALGLLTVLMHPSQPNLVLLDDIEQGLHPKAQRELMGVFKEIIHENPDLQIIFSTHSSYIVDELIPSQVHVLSVDASGITQTKRLDEHPDVEWAKQTLTTGEFWDAEGEDWVIAG